MIVLLIQTSRWVNMKIRSRIDLLASIVVVVIRHFCMIRWRNLQNMYSILSLTCTAFDRQLLRMNVHSLQLHLRVFIPFWRLRWNIIRTALCWTVWHNVHSPQHTYVSSSYRSNRLGLSHWDPYAVHRGGCIELYYCNMVEWFWWDSSLILTTSWFPSVLFYCCLLYTSPSPRD